LSILTTTSFKLGSHKSLVHNARNRSVESTLLKFCDVYDVKNQSEISDRFLALWTQGFKFISD